MKTIKKFLSKNKNEMKVLAYGVGMMTFGIFIGTQVERKSMDKMVIRMANNGKSSYKILGNELYKMTIIKDQFK